MFPLGFGQLLENHRHIRASHRNDWLGFDNPMQTPLSWVYLHGSHALFEPSRCPFFLFSHRQKWLSVSIQNSFVGFDIHDLLHGSFLLSDWFLGLCGSFLQRVLPFALLRARKQHILGRFFTRTHFQNELIKHSCILTALNGLAALDVLAHPFLSSFLVMSLFTFNSLTF